MATMRLFAAGIACSMLGLSDAAGKCVTVSTGAWAVEDAANAEDCTPLPGQWIGESQQESFSLDSPWTAAKRKSWWTKRLVPVEHRLYFGGRPSIRDVKYLYEQGFDAVYNVLGGDGGGTLGDEAQATVVEATATAAEAGLMYRSAPVTDDNAWNSAAIIDDLTKFIDFALAETDGPIYVHCGSGHGASAALQMYRLRKDAALTARPLGSAPMTVQGAIDEVAAHGFDISGFSAALSREAGVAAAEVTAPTDHGTDQINKYHWMKYLGSFGDVKMFDAGQVHTGHIAAAQAAGIKVVVNMRRDAVGTSSQEETNLLNLGSKPKTVQPAVDCTDAGCTDAKPAVARTDAAAVLTHWPQFVTDPDRPTTWIGDANGIYNFESTNAFEFGDDAGYNSDTEKAAWEAAGVPYVHVPIAGGSDYSAAKLLSVSAEMIQAINTAQAAGGHVLWHCRTGFRTGAFPSALFAVIRDDEAAAIGDRLAKLGYNFRSSVKTLIDDATANLECPDCVVATTGAVTGTFQFTAAAAERIALCNACPGECADPATHHTMPDGSCMAGAAMEPMKTSPMKTSAAAAVVPCAAALLASVFFWA